jgi:hypothetical protein
LSDSTGTTMPSPGVTCAPAQMRGASAQRARKRVRCARVSTRLQQIFVELWVHGAHHKARDPVLRKRMNGTSDGTQRASALAF